MRRDYQMQRLDQQDLNPSPFGQFQKWFNEAVSASVIEPNAMSLATVSADKPSCRIVLMKHFDTSGLTFFTNYTSRKAQELLSTPHATVNFFWKELERQVNIEGSVVKTDRRESEEYFAVRPRASQLAAWASPQDKVLTSRQELENAYQVMEEQYHDKEVPLPDFWGGFRLIPDRFEFWQGRRNRLHDRFRYTLLQGYWTVERLAP